MPPNKALPAMERNVEGVIASVGFKLPLGPAEDPAWKAALGSVNDLHGFLADLGFSYAEYPVGSLEDPRFAIERVGNQ